jgi:hypothetical protein
MPEDALLRSSDLERDQALAALSDHFAQGRLSLDELNQRVDQALSATTRAGLAATLADLPVTASTPSRPPTTDRGRRQPDPRWSSWVATAAICLTIWLVTSLASGSVLYFWPVWVVGPWGVALAARTRSPQLRSGASRGCPLTSSHR